MFQVLIIEPFFAGSHKNWIEGLQKNSGFKIEVLSLSGRHWKWRMHGAAVTLAKKYEELGYSPDLIIASDMLDVTTFQALTRSKTYDIPFVLYFHENQLTYPWSPSDEDKALQRDNHYSFINYTSALSVDSVLFNSNYHKTSFLNALPKFLKSFPDYNNLDTIKEIEKKSKVLHLGLDLRSFDQYRENKNLDQLPTILWNHRWEYDKNPRDFFDVLKMVKEKGCSFNLIVLGEQYSKVPYEFEKAKQEFKDEIIHWGYVERFEDYANWLWRTDILPVTSNQDFFGISVVEAIYCNTYPILPNRLSYLEHLPEADQTIYVYSTKYELEEKLIQAIKNIELTRSFNLQSFIRKYDWSDIIKEYDRCFAEIIEQYQP